MKKITLFIFVAILCTGVMNAGNFGGEIELGMNVSTMSKFDSKVGFRMGFRGILNLPELTDGVYVNGGLFLSKKGGEVEQDKVTVSSSAYYLEVPVHIGFRCDLLESVAIFSEIGPYIGAGIFGDTKVKTSDIGDEKFSTFGDEHLLKRFDFGLGIRAGVIIFSQMPVSIGYDFGLIDNSSVKDMSIKHGNFTASVGWIF